MLRRVANKSVASFFSVGALALIACVKQSNSNTLNPELRRDTSRLEPAHQFSDELSEVLPESVEEAANFSSSKAGKKISRVLGRSLNRSDLITLVALHQLIFAQRAVRMGNVGETRRRSSSVLRTPELSLAMYQSALRYLAMADVIELTDQASSSPAVVDSPRSPLSDFNSFQNLQCSFACSTLGWQILVRENPNLFNLAGYQRSLLSDEAFRNEGMSAPRWLSQLWKTNTPEQSKTIVMTEPNEQKNTQLSQTLKLRALADARRWNEAFILANNIAAVPTQQKNSSKQSAECRSSVIFSQFVLAQSFRMRQDRKKFASFQEKFVEMLDNSPCRASDFGMDDEKFEAFKLDARLWLARLEWEQNKNPQAFHTARLALSESLRLKSWEHYFDAAKIVVGRIGFEMLSPPENIALLASIEDAVIETDSDDFPAWLNSRKGLIHFLQGDYSNSQKAFEKVIELTSNNSTRAMAFYWKGRTTREVKSSSDSENSLILSGTTDPLSIYDIFSGQILESKSGRASTQAQRAFKADWQDEYRAWMSFSDSSPLKILSTPPVTTINATSNPAFTNELLDDSLRQFENSLRNTILLLAIHKAIEQQESKTEFFQQVADTNELSTELLKSEVKYLRHAFAELSSATNEVLPKAHQIAWLTYALGDFANAILFVGRLRNSIGWDNDYLPFLYFIFYPRPYYQEFRAASETCGVDIDLLYAISRQESLFQSSVKSHAGAVGLMQLLPTTARRILTQLPDYADGKRIDLTQPATNTLAGSCYLRDLLRRYNNNLAYAIAAYNAGEGAVDTWIARREKLSDIPYFIEFIPYAETQTYVQRVLRNYYNIKWIYQSQN